MDEKGIFVSYRRDETAGYAGRLADRLNDHFGEHKVFRDIDSIDPGLDFVEAIQRAVDSSEVLIAVIGRNWLSATDTAGRERLQDPHDYVRMEIATALDRNIRVIPVLVQGASMPATHELPEDLAPNPPQRFRAARLQLERRRPAPSYRARESSREWG